MVRVLFVIVLAAILAVALTSLHAALSTRARRRVPPPAPYMTKVSAMPAALKNLSYALLIALMFGIVTGWIGG